MSEIPELTFEQIRLGCVIYTSAILPLLLIPYLAWKKKIPAWSFKVYVLSFLVCALGWELWFTYGLWAGDSVELRRAQGLNHYIPKHINWLLNSLADAGAICMMGIFYVWYFSKKSFRAFEKWHWPAFGILLFFFIGQNIFVEMFLYHDQLSVGKPLSWAPLAPTGPWFNPVLFEFNDRTITLQGQMPWLILTPLFYWCVIRMYPKDQEADG